MVGGVACLHHQRKFLVEVKILTRIDQKPFSRLKSAFAVKIFRSTEKIFHFASDLLDFSVGGKASKQHILWSVGVRSVGPEKISGRGEILTRIDQKPFSRLKSAFAVKNFRSTGKFFTSTLTCWI